MRLHWAAAVSWARKAAVAAMRIYRVNFRQSSTPRPGPTIPWPRIHLSFLYRSLHSPCLIPSYIIQR